MPSFAYHPVQPETMHPALTRGGLGSRGRLHIECFAQTPSDFIASSDGIWLPPIEVVRRDKKLSLQRLGAIAHSISFEKTQRHTQRIAEAVDNSRVTENGCLIGGVSPRRHAQFLLYLAELDWGTPPFETGSDLQDVQLCSSNNCLNTRHYDFEFTRPTLRERRVEFDPRFYTIDADGSILTPWGDTLPPVTTSQAAYTDFVHRCYPYVPNDRSPLSPTSISQIRFISQSGCWESWQYYTKPEHGLNWQFDGYGRMNGRHPVTRIDTHTGETATKPAGQMLAHRIVWVASGRELIPGQVLNHRCRYRRCCNPLHLEQVSTGANNAHGRRMKKAILRIDHPTLF